MNAADAPRRSARWILLAAAALLVGALLLQVWVSLNRAPVVAVPYGALADLLPKALPGVVVRDEAIADTEEMKKAVAELLNYDDAIFRHYEWGGKRLSVYIARWAPGKMSHRLVTSHNPDVCWPVSGWERSYGFEKTPAALDAVLTREGVTPGTNRLFTKGPVSQYTVFWHRIGDTFSSFGEDGAPPWWALFGDIWRYGLDQRREQYFIRISCTVPLEQVWELPLIEPVRKVLPSLGLAKK